MLKFILFIRSISWTAVFAVALLILALTILLFTADAPKAIALALAANVLATLRAKED